MDPQPARPSHSPARASQLDLLAGALHWAALWPGLPQLKQAPRLRRTFTSWGVRPGTKLGFPEWSGGAVLAVSWAPAPKRGFLGARGLLEGSAQRGAWEALSLSQASATAMV
jgi:hypothetical protein